MSIQKLADALGLAPSTVSRALNGYADINVKTRQRVQEAARDMKYRPHPVAHRLATGRNGAIALMTSVRAGNYLDASFAALLSGAAEVLREQGYFAMSLALPVGDGELKEMDRLIEGRLVDGVILARTRTFDSRVALLQERRIPFVTHGRTETNAPHAWVDTDNEQAFYVATRRLIELGHRHLSMINGPESMTYAQLRKRGFLRACSEAGMDQSKISIQHCEVTSQAGERAANEILTGSPQVTGLVCATDSQALGAMSACRQRGIQVGRDISVTGYGNSEAAAYASPPLSTIEHAIVDNGRHLAELLLRVMAGDDLNALNRLEPVHFIERPSIGAMRQAPSRKVRTGTKS
ncbi:HTH-type transcriptional regulator RafR [Curvibacter sp. AEP1-3]|uniref:LacI family DNA-binding transcriptional regulator n=1 Tax=Curvibacter sp. AEP1-3 TaxID=1844971 RepID=UPI000B3C4A42|nr:LacI family DNA-binding transcriptional regulator [Curvibacter sp. AEP1-3]ARV17882.1 HTH-type transcriptional regulator RafR [Curvibacter sp. AEP1-3]